MDPCLLKKISTELPVWRKYSSAPVLNGYSKVTSLTPIIKDFLSTNPPESEGQLQADELFGRVNEFEGSGSCIVETVGRKKRKSFCKVTHLLDPIRNIQGYYNHSEKGERRKQEKSSNPMNQAFVDGLANYLFGQIRERKLSPHFCLFYGGFQAIADEYRFAITDEFESYRKYKNFWVNKKKGLFDLFVEDLEDDLNTPSSSLHSGSFTYSTPRSNCSKAESHISLDDEIEVNTNGVELESVNSLNDMEEGPVLHEESEEETDEDDEEEEEEEVEIYATFKKYPVMLIFQEEMEGVLEDLLEDEEEQKDQGTPLWEDRWSAWIFQICSALCAAQGVLGFTHNDLHTNNIVWMNTDEPWLYYKNRAGEVWRVPTHGKIFRIIDFGRGIYRVGDKWFISDDYERGGDAEGQYNFETMRNYKESKQKVYPNPSFDLCRLSVSIIDALFPTMPIEKLDGIILNKEDDWEVHETESPLWNLLWSWLIDDKGKNVLRDEDGTERFPDFDLYSHVSAHVFCAKPQEQICRDIFNKYKFDGNMVGDWETVYPLFF
jgi:hypothetical protein